MQNLTNKIIMKQLKRGILIAVEGIDGSGKSTLSFNLSKDMTAKGWPVHLTKEPGDTPLGAHLRTLLHDKDIEKTAKAEYLLFASDRAQHMSSVVLPALERNMIVISDRLGDSSVVYQGFARGIDIDMIKCVNRWAMEDREPDLILCVHVPPDVARNRLLQRNMPLTSFEQESSKFFQKVAEGFALLVDTEEHAYPVDGAQEPHIVMQQAWEIIHSWIANNNVLV